MRNLFLTIILMCTSILCVSQSTNISGVINTYTSVSGLSDDTISVASSVGFSVGDKLLIIQMQGATIDESNTSSFGDITSINDAGNYEFSIICNVLDATTIIVKGIQRTYDPSGIIQAVRVPVYNNAIITAMLTAPAWNGLTGGVLAFECTGALTMNDEINLQGAGFRGGAVTTSTYSCAWFDNVQDYHYNIITGEGAMKGEGVALYISNKTGGRGAQANGGGGGNDHNSGGGGGANASAGGLGGERIKPSTFTCQGLSPGVGGKPNTYTNALNKIFLGGGGGAGHENNPATGTSGGNGGGIVIAKADTIIGNGNTINVGGASVLASSADGAGGAGAGGTILLDVSTYIGTLAVYASGGNGGNVSNLGPSNCNGPGGGGSGGILWVNQSSVPLSIALTNNGGANGTTLNTLQFNCTMGGNNGATVGNSGNTVTNLSLVETICNIPLTIQAATLCDSDSSYLAGSWQFSSGVFYDTLNTGCCDSIVETTLTVLPTLMSTINQTICNGDSIVVNGTTYNSSVTGATEIFTNIGPNNCDSTVTINLTVLSAIDTSTTLSGLVISSNQVGANYQWIDCTNGNNPIPGATSNSYTVTNNGDYAVIVTVGTCSDTSACINITSVAVIENGFVSDLQLFPNPTSGNFSIDLGQNYHTVTITITDLSGKIIHSKTHEESQLLNLNLNNPAGVYLLTIKSEDKKAVIRLIKN